jgi:hypothetical protein
MDVENTDLGRRVLAHEQILQVLVANMSESEPKFLDRLQQIFTKHHMGAGERGPHRYGLITGAVYPASGTAW